MSTDEYGYGIADRIHSSRLEKALYKKLEDNTWFAEISEFEGLWANAGTVEECRSELIEVLEESVILKIRDADPLPIVEGFTIRVQQEAAG